MKSLRRKKTKDKEGCAMQDVSGSIDWYMSKPDITIKHLAADIEIGKAREARRIERLRTGGRLASDNAKRENSLLYGLGKGRTVGGVVECGRFLEIYATEESTHIGNGIAGIKEENNKPPESVESIARRVNHRARKQIRRLVNRNELNGMITLTIAPPSEQNDEIYSTVTYENQKDYSFVRRLFKVFVQRVRRASKDFEYLAVFELHNSGKTSAEKRGCWHIHIAVRARDDKYEKERSCWGYGMSDYQDFRFDKQGKRRELDIQNPGAYVAEYIGKEGAQFGEEDLVRKRRFTRSKGIVNPTKNRLEDTGIKGDFDLIEFRGRLYKNTFYSSRHVPGTQLFKLSATYQLLEEKIL